MSKIGMLQQVNDTNVMIDDVWYDGSAIKQYIPEQTNIQVEYNHDENNVLAFIRTKTAYTPKQTKGGYKKRAPYTPKNTGGNDARTNSIIKQVIFKVAGGLTGSTKHESLDDAIQAFDSTYNTLLKKYLDDLKK